MSPASGNYPCALCLCEFDGSRGLVGVESHTLAYRLSVDLPWFPFCFTLALRILVRVEVSVWGLRRPFGDKGQPPPTICVCRVLARPPGGGPSSPVSESAGPPLAPSRRPFPEPLLRSAEMIVALDAVCVVCRLCGTEGIRLSLSAHPVFLSY